MAQSWLQQPLLRMKSSWRRADEQAPTYAELSVLWHEERVKNRALAAERDRYRAALERIAAARPGTNCADLARHALEGER